jgi:hypothetical protein
MIGADHALAWAVTSIRLPSIALLGSLCILSVAAWWIKGGFRLWGLKLLYLFYQLSLPLAICAYCGHSFLRMLPLYIAYLALKGRDAFRVIGKKIGCFEYRCNNRSRSQI